MYCVITNDPDEEDLRVALQKGFQPTSRWLHGRYAAYASEQ